MKKGFSPLLVVPIAYLGTWVCFLLICLLPEELGLDLPHWLSLSWGDRPWQPFTFWIPLIPFILWSAHYLKRTLEVFFVHRSHRRMPFHELIGAPIYYCLFGVWIALNLVDPDYHPVRIEWEWVGIAVFAVGEIGNFYHHLILRRLRKDPTQQGHSIPRGGMFKWVSCPHYFFEVLSWLGFFLATLCLASLGFLVISLVVVAARAMDKHKVYLKEFDGQEGRELYPQGRKAMIPFLF